MAEPTLKSLTRQPETTGPAIDENTASSGHRAAAIVPLQRSVGSAQIGFKTRGPHTVLDTVHQAGCCKVRFPRPEPGNAPEAVLINTAGGLTDSDVLAVEAVWRRGTCAALSSQAAERIYRSRGIPARITNSLRIASGATGLWLPQESILFDGGRLSRRLTASIEDGGQLLACESTVFGRRAMGETVQVGSLADSWRIRFDGRLVFADAFAIDGTIADRLNRAAVANGANAVASILYVGRAADRLLTVFRDVAECFGTTAGSSVIGPVLHIRLLAETGAVLRRDLAASLRLLLGQLETGRDGFAGPAAVLPRVWSC